MPETRKKSKTRRQIVKAVDDMQDPSYRPPVIPKSDEAKARITAGIAKNELLSHLSDAQKEVIVNGVMEVPTQAGDAVINQGENGNHFYLIDKGCFNVFLQSAGDKPIATYRAGDSFGELALLYNSPRAATILCEEDGTLWALERKAFRYAMQTLGKEMGATAESFLATVQLLKPLSPSQRSMVAHHLEELALNDGEYVVQKGAVADALFFIKDGQLAVTNEKGEETARLQTGAVFGESCLEADSHDAVRQANVIAVGKVKVLRLTRKDFVETCGQLQDIVANSFKRKVLEGMMIDGTHIFTNLMYEDQELLMSKLADTVFEDGKEIIKQGATNNTFYVVKTGEAVVFSSGKEVAKLHAGQFFGERALLKDEPASASVKASGALHCYTCDRATFTAVLGPMQELIDKEVARRDRMAVAKPQILWKDLEVRRLLGCGTFGRVRLVVHKPTGQSYALKGMRKEQIVEMKQQKNIINEKKILEMMDHPFILTLAADYHDNAEVYMLLELALGGELFSLLQKKAPLPDKEAMFYVAQVVAIFAFMQSQKVVYRDLKPENLLLDSSGYIKMIDFGFAKILTEKTWTLCGTPEYLAPEIIKNAGHSFEVDWWCSGILAYECLMGVTPFVCDDQMESYRKIIKCKVAWPRSFSAGAKEFEEKLIVADPKKRMGCLKNGPADVKNLSWFKDLDWKKLEAKQMTAPHVPKIKSNTDDSNFDDFEDEAILHYKKANYKKEDPDFAAFSNNWVGA
jgi:cGMP-dependent protein kinase